MPLLNLFDRPKHVSAELANVKVFTDFNGEQRTKNWCTVRDDLIARHTVFLQEILVEAKSQKFINRLTQMQSKYFTDTLDFAGSEEYTVEYHTLLRRIEDSLRLYANAREVIATLLSVHRHLENSETKDA